MFAKADRSARVVSVYLKAGTECGIAAPGSESSHNFRDHGDC